MNIVQIISDPYVLPFAGADLRNEAIRANLIQYGNVVQVTPEMFLMPLPADDLQDGLNSSPDLIVVEGVQLMGVAQKMHALYPEARFIFDFHNVESDLLRQQDIAKLPSVLRPFAPIVFHKRWRKARALDLFALEMAETVWVCSAEDKQRVSKLCKNPPRIAIVPNLAPNSIEKIKPQEPVQARNRPVLLFVGHLGYAPNKHAVRHLVRKVMPRLLRQNRDVRLIVAGRRPNARLIGLLEKKNFVHLVANPEYIAPIYAQADIVVVPLAEGGGSRIKILEALAIGIPIVATAKAVEGLDLVPERHFLQAENAMDMVKAITRLIKDTPLAQQLVVEGFAHLEENFTHERVRREIGTSF
jgi:glycosyltransferase involved in cell wall biosynthesis